MSILNVPKIRQAQSDTCGIASVAMVVSFLKAPVTELYIKNSYGYSLLAALQGELQSEYYIDYGDFTPLDWNEIEKVIKAGKPVIIGLNGEFSPSGRGHIVVIAGIEGNNVYYNDPAVGDRRITTKQAIENCPPHPDGKFLLMYNPAKIQVIREDKTEEFRLIKLYIKEPSAIAMDGKIYDIKGANELVLKVSERK